MFDYVILYLVVIVLPAKLDDDDDEDISRLSAHFDAFPYKSDASHSFDVCSSFPTRSHHPPSTYSFSYQTASFNKFFHFVCSTDSFS